MEKAMTALMALYREIQDHMEEPQDPLMCSAANMRHCAHIEHYFSEAKAALAELGIK